MSVESTTTGMASGTAQSGARQMLDPAKALFLPIYGVVEAAQERLAAKLDTNQDGGVDLEELKALGGLGSGKNGPAAFAALDSNGDGKLNLQELRGSKVFTPEVLNTLLGQQDGNGLAEWLVSEGDGDGDNALTLEEFRTVGPVAPFGPGQGPVAESLDWSERAFTAADSNADGQVTAAELAGVTEVYVRRLIPSQNPAAVAASLMGRDEDRSGGLSAAELSRRDAGEILALADTDQDGELSLAELQAEIGRAPEYYASGLMKLTAPAPPPLEPADPADPASRLRTISAFAGRMPFEPPPAGRAALYGLFREQMARLTDEIISDAAGAIADDKA